MTWEGLSPVAAKDSLGSANMTLFRLGRFIKYFGWQHHLISVVFFLGQVVRLM